MTSLTLPSNQDVMRALLRADFTTQWRNRKSLVLILLVPIIILISWKGLVDKMGGPFVLANCITIGLTAIGLMGYSNSVARDREKGIFHRLRVAPVAPASIMISRLCVQLIMILLMTTAVFLAGNYFDSILLTPTGYILGYLAAFLGGTVYLGLGQAVVGRIKNAETVHSTSRLIYFVFIMVGMFGELGVLGKQIGELVKWSPYGAVKHILSSGFTSGSRDTSAFIALLVTLGYALFFSILGIRWFRWNAST